MKRMKAILSWLLVVCMMLGMLPAIATTAKAATAEYTLVTSTSDLVVGGTYVIAAAGYDYAMSSTQNTNNRGQVAITKSGDKSTLYGADTVQEFTLQAGDSTVTGTTYAFLATGTTSPGYIYAASSSKNYLKTETTLSANSSWTVVIASDGTATLTAQGTNTRNVLQYNSTSGLFSCYSSSQQGIALYRKTDSTGGGGGGGGDTPTETTVNASLLIVTGEGEAYFTRDGVQTGNPVTTRGERVYSSVVVGETITVVIKPAADYRLACLELSSDRCDPGTELKQYHYDAGLGAYVCSFVVNASAAQNAFRISFLPRISDAGYTATQITGWDNTKASGLYVITGMKSPEDYTNNTHSTATTYLLYGDDATALDDGREAIGRKSSALLLSNIGVSLSDQSPYQMTGLNECHLMEFTRYGATDYFTIRLYGATDAARYICAKSSTAPEIRIVDDYMSSATEVNNYALWSVTYLDNGAVQILNAGTNRYLCFNSKSSNLQFRCYTATNLSNGDADYPVLYGASQDNYQVSYSVNGSGSISAINTTTGSSVASGTYQSKGSNITFTFTPAAGSEIGSVTLNGTAVELTGNMYIYSGLDQNINVVVTYVTADSVSFNVEYYLNDTLMVTKPVSAISPYIIDSTVTIHYNEKDWPVSSFSFDRSVNGTAVYADLNAAIEVSNGDTIKAYFSTTAVDRIKEIRETTTAANAKDEHGNVKQTFEITLGVSSNDMIEESSQGGNTDIIAILDNSNSMYPDYSTNAADLLSALESFAEIAFAEGSNNRVAVVRYGSLAHAYLKTSDGYYRTAYNGSSDPADYTSITYDNCFLTSATDFNTLVGYALQQDSENGATNTMGGWKMAEAVARTRSTDTTRNLVVLMFTDGKPTVRYSAASGSTTVVRDYASSETEESNTGALHTSTIEHNWSIDAAESLRACLDGYTNCTSKIYNVALLNDSEYTDNDRTLVEYMMGNDVTYYWNYSTNYVEASSFVDNTDYWTTHAPYADAYIPIIGAVDVKTQLKDVFTMIAYSTIPAKYVTGTLTDTIPAYFVLTPESKAALTAAGWTITNNSNGTTTISRKITATETMTYLTYEVEYQGGGYGGAYSNTSAYFTYYNLQTDEEMTTYFPMPVAQVIPWTVNDQSNTYLSTKTTIDILGNDLFTVLTDGGYTLSNLVITLTDANGNPTVYNDAVEQAGCGFDASVDTASNTVTFYTEQGGGKTFYYVLTATVIAPDGTTKEVTSRVTTVYVVVPNVNLTKTAQDVSDSYTPVVKDAYGNVKQVFLVTLNVTKVNAGDVVSNGVIKDTIPSNFEFVAFDSKPGTSCTCTDNLITCEGITMDSTTQSVTLSYYIRYKGNGYGVIPTNASASLEYSFGGMTGKTTQYFPVPYVTVNPATVNDVDIAAAGATYTIGLQNNDLYNTATAGGYTVSSVTNVLTNAKGVALTASEIAALGISAVVNADGSLTYTAPSDAGATQFYYAVTATATAPDGTVLNISSRPTMVTIYTVKRTVQVIDFGLKTKDITFADYSGIYVDEGVPLSNLVTTGNFAGSSTYGTLTAKDGKVSFQPTTMEFGGFATYDCVYEMKASVYNVNTAKSVTGGFIVVPANNLYFEENFLEFDDAWGDEGTSKTDATQAAGEEHNTAVHGYDAAYAAQESYSNGNQKSVTVSKDTREHAAFFTFTGTGFDIIGSTTPNSGVMVAQIYRYDPTAVNGCGTPVKNILVDTWLENYSYDQIPVIAFRGDYGTYRVKVRAFYNEIFDHNYAPADVSESVVRQVLGLDSKAPLEISKFSVEGATVSTRAAGAAANGQYNVYLDAVRIYNPLGAMTDETMSTAAKLYAAAGEMNPVFTNVRDALLKSNNWAQDAAAGGVLYIAADNSDTGADGDAVYSGIHLGREGQLYTKEGEDGKLYLINENGDNVLYAGAYPVYTNNGDYFYEKDGVEYKLTKEQVSTMGIAFYNDKYDLIGPKNEVYLKNNQGIAFAVSINATAQISLKIPYGTSATLQMYNGTKWVDIATVSSRTEMYYTIDTDLITGGLAILRCASADANTVLSVCNLKLASSNAVTTGGIMAMTPEQMVRAIHVISDQEHEHTWSEWEVITEPTCTQMGTKTRTCSGCGEYEALDIGPTGHSYGEWTATVYATCTTKGEEARTCENCGDEETRETDVIVCPSADFTDVAEDVWYHDAVDFMMYYGYMKGVDDGIFRPNGTLNRAMVVTVLYRLAGKPEVTEPASFEDVPTGEWYSDAIAWAQKEGVVDGISETKFAPMNAVTREQIAVILYRYSGAQKQEADLSAYGDSDTISAWAVDAMAWAVSEGIFKGDEKGNLNPAANATRAEFAMILMRFLTK